MKEILVTEPKFASDFACIGGECREHCCQGWTISFDKASVRRYIKSKDLTIRAIARDGINITKKNEGHWGEVIFSEKTNNCPFMDSERLCTVHKKLGGAALSHTCSTYPRGARTYKNEIEKFVSLSCPEATRLLLTDPEAMLMNQSIDIQPSFNNAIAKGDVQKVVHLFCMSLLSIDSGSIESNIYAIVKLLLYIERVGSVEGHINDIENAYHNISASLLDGSIAQELLKFNKNYKLKSSVMFLLQTYLKSRDSFRGYTVLKTYLDALNTLAEVSDNDSEGALPLSEIERSWDESVRPWLKERQYIFANFFKYKLWQKNFPQDNGREYLANFYLIVAEYYFLKTLIGAFLTTKAPISEDVLINAIYSFHSLTQHSSSAEEVFQKYLETIKLGDNLSLIQLLN